MVDTSEYVTIMTRMKTTTKAAATKTAPPPVDMSWWDEEEMGGLLEESPLVERLESVTGTLSLPGLWVYAE
jgi:hypothetical protein